MTTRLQELLTTGALESAQLLAVGVPADPPVERLAVIETFADLRDVRRHDLMLLGLADGRGGWFVDAAVRAAWERYAAAVVVPLGATVFSAPAQLAARLGVTLLAQRVDRVADTAALLAAQIASAEDEWSRRCLDLVQRIEADPAQPDAIVEALLAFLGRVEVSVLITSGAALHGPERPELSEAILTRVVGPGPTRLDDGRLLVWPAQAHPTALGLFLAARLPAPVSERWLRQLRPAFALATARLSQWALRDELDLEETAPRRARVLAALIDAHPERRDFVLGEALRFGWPVHGFHQAFHVLRPAGMAEWHGPVGTHRMRALLVAEQVRGPVIAVEDGWFGWTTWEASPNRAARGRLGERLAQVAQRLPRARITIGVGEVGEGPDGLAASLRQARGEAEAAALTSASGVFPAGGGLLRHLLVEPLRSPALNAPPSGPVQRLRDEGLIRAAWALLATPSLAAAAQLLGVHRNTVSARQERIRAIVGAAWDDPDERLALLLACRVLLAAPAEPGEAPS